LAVPRESSGRIPPHSLEAEIAVLGAVLLSNHALNQAVELLRPEDFYDPRHAVIFEAMIDLAEELKPVDRVTLAETLKAKGRYDQVGGGAYLAQLDLAEPSAANAPHYAKLIKDYSLARQLIKRAEAIVSDSFEAGQDIEGLLDRAEQSIFEVAEAKVKPSFHPLRSLVNQVFKVIEERYERKEIVTGVPTGFIELDNLTAGLQPSDLIIVAGRPSMGKTALALNIAVHAAARAEVGVAIFSLEMSKEQLVTRMLGSEAKVDARSLRTGFISEKAWTPLTDAAGILSNTPIFIDDTPAIDVLEMRAKARRLKREHNIGLVVVDYLQLMQGRQGLERREQEISDISRSLKAMAKELDLPVLTLSQLNRKVEERTNRRPMLADLRESGAIEQDADVILFIYRDEVYNTSPDNPNRGKAEVIIGKQRNGPTGKVDLHFNGRFTRFDTLDKTHEDHLSAAGAGAPF